MDKDKNKQKELNDVKLIMDVTTKRLVEKMEKIKFRENIFKQSQMFTKEELEQVVKDWGTLTTKTKIEWFETVLFKTKDEKGKTQTKTFDDILMIVNLLKTNKLNINKTFKEIKNYGDNKKKNEK